MEGRACINRSSNLISRLEYNCLQYLSGEKLSKIGLQEEIDKLTAKLHQLTSDSQLSSVDQTNDNSGAIEAAKHKIESLYLQKTELDKECLLLKERFGRNLKAGEVSS